MTAPAPPAAEFDCGCYARLRPDWSLELWQCVVGDDCPSWRLITGALGLCVRQLQIHALVPRSSIGPGAGGSL